MLLLIGYYLLYFRHRLMYRYNLEQVLEINKQAFTGSLLTGQTDKDIAACLVNAMFEGMDELIAIDILGIAVYSEDSHNLKYGFSLSDEENEDMLRVLCLISTVL